MTKSKIITLSQPKSDGLIDKVIKNKSLIINIVMMFSLFCLILTFFYLRSNKSKTQSSQYIQSSLDSWQQLESEGNLSKLTKMANQYPFLQTQLDTLLAQECLNNQQIESTKTLQNRIEKRLSPHLAFLFEFNKVSILMTEGHYQEALERSYELKSKIDSQKMQTLFAFQLLRIAALEEKVGNHKGFISALNNFKDYTAQMNDSLEFKLGKLSLTDFVAKMSDQKD